MPSSPSVFIHPLTSRREVVNYSTGKGVVVTIDGGYGTLCGQSAEWILEDPSVNGGLAAFPDYSASTFFSASATATDGQTYGLDAAHPMYLLDASSNTICQAALDGNGNYYVQE